MEPVLYVMAIMGCGDGSTMCSEARIDRAQYRSIQACQAAMPETLHRHSDLSFPELAATCRRVTPLWAGARKPVRSGG